ncbi:ABC transporter ATP-binding protein [Truepera radiovictrix]|uniref:ABC transporter related protein n=1 Tax=Truepera radiovictrix (strain DSM 17093 / CIP 108686 / LMG 22925 / RQ-24) TaxID=649638 RepID=D7CU61_TRURR|nr:ABC transporter ATP-binding protein [Truepera radiovictrix]ADI13959.1 ABC transporter related protein [Truepera radiovictrix DSM 17093]WMT57477.1 ABC transporter ATP-binding protein [Truepera radiovictrix]
MAPAAPAVRVAPASAAAPVIEAEGLSKRYGTFVAVAGLDLRVAPGEVYGLLGPNGSGKTTTILMLLGLTEPSGGRVRVLGFDPAREPLEVKRRVGYLPDAVGFYDDLSARENLRYSARLMGLPRAEREGRIEAVLTRMGLAEVADKRVGAFSRGMRQRLGLAEVLLKAPQVAVLDEPTASLDPSSADEFLDLIRSLKAEGITVLLSSHLLHQVQAVCDRVGLFRAGRLELEGTVEALSQRVLGSAYHIEVEAHGEAVEAALRGVPGVLGVERRGAGRYRAAARTDLRPQLAAAVAGCGGALYGLQLEARSLDEVYAHHFGRAGRAAHPEEVGRGVA